MTKKQIRMRCFIGMLIMIFVFFAVGFAENAVDSAAEATAAVETVEEAAEEAAETAEETEEQDFENPDYIADISFTQGIKNIAESTGLAHGAWQNYVMIVVACVLLYLAIVKQFEPLLLLPIAFGMLLSNLPLAGMMADPVVNLYESIEDATVYAGKYGKDIATVWKQGYFENGAFIADTTKEYIQCYSVDASNGGLLYYLYKGVKLGIYPPLIFMGVGAGTDFAPLIANPKTLLLGAAAQLGIFLTYIGARLLGFSAKEAGSIGIIGGADGPTAIFVTTRLAPHLLGAIAVAAYSYMALVPVIQPPIMRALTTKKERQIRMKQLRPVTKTELIIFPIMVTIVVSLLLPDAAPLIGMLMLGNLMRVSGVVERIKKTAENELMNIVTIFLGLTVGATTNGQNFLTGQTLKILAMGIIAFSCGTAGGVLLAKLLNVLSGGNAINPLIGSAGVSAVPMAARVSQVEGQKEDPGNFLLMHAMGPNVAGVIGSAVAAGVFMALFGK